MFLKSLEVFGFKSFADRTRIEFANGVTALLGPNGCGKSNVVDAVKWVLGEQTSKNLRAKKMEDVIFSGTENRKALNVAEVTLTIANEQGLLPIDFSEISIKRRLYRSGESEYYINGNIAKLKDVRELFWDTGVGKAAYSVMEQGKIDQILSSKPEDRRYLFEEAAGITRFKVKRAEAEGTLARTEENMRQVEGILGEVKKSYDSLKIQAEKTNCYRSLKEELFNNELDIQLLRLKSFSQDKDTKVNELKKIGIKREDAKNQIDEINAAVASHMDQVNSMQKKLVDLQIQLASLAKEQNFKSEQAKDFSLRQKEIKNKVIQLEGRKAGIEERIEDLNEEIADSESSLHDLNRKLSDIAKNIEEFTQNISIASGQITENDKSVSVLQTTILQLNEKREILQKDLQSITEDIVTELDSKLKDVGYSSVSRKKNEEEINNLLSQIQIIFKGRKDLFTDFSKISNHSYEDINRITESSLSSFLELEELLKKLKSAFEEYSKSSPGFIDEFLSPEGIITKKRAIDNKILDNRSVYEENQKKIADLHDSNGNLSKKITEYKATLEKLNLNQVQMKAQIETKQHSIGFLKRDLASQEGLLKDLDNEIYTENRHLEQMNEQILEIESEIASIQYQGEKLGKELEDLQNEISSKNKDVTGKQASIVKKTEELSHLQIQFEKIDREIAASDVEIRNLKENFKEAHSRDLMEFEQRMFEINTPIPVLREKLADTRQKLKDLGGVNFMAPEEFAETKERYEFLSNQLADLQKAKDDLKRITEEIRAEATELFLLTYNKIKKNFHNMFRRLFGGGRAELKLLDPQNVLESGVDIFAQPPGKKLENIALLSGGEKTMTAVALMFATYMVRPSPFCLLDEIDAALDENNVTRFINTLRDFANVSQYIIITHNKKTAAGSTTLLGVTMQESGISRVVTIRLDNEKGTIAPLPETEPFEEEDVAPEENVYIPPHTLRRNKNVEQD
ncbi:MAG: chromosome segregation SMC family protein [Treponemataceae bacterium]